MRCDLTTAYGISRRACVLFTLTQSGISWRFSKENTIIKMPRTHHGPVQDNFLGIGKAKNTIIKMARMNHGPRARQLFQDRQGLNSVPPRKETREKKRTTTIIIFAFKDHVSFLRSSYLINSSAQPTFPELPEGHEGKCIRFLFYMSLRIICVRYLLLIGPLN